MKQIDPAVASAFLHVVAVDGGYSRHQHSDNPVPLGPGRTAIVWNDVPAGKHAAFVEIVPQNAAKTKGSSAARRSRPSFFSRVSQDARVLAAATRADTEQQQKQWDEGEHFDETDQDGASSSNDAASNEWPLLLHLQRLNNPSPPPTHTNPLTPPRSPPHTAGDSKPRQHPPRPQHVASEGSGASWCGVSQWEAVSMHEVVASFLQAEWYKVCVCVCACVYMCVCVCVCVRVTRVRVGCRSGRQ